MTNSQAKQLLANDSFRSLATITVADVDTLLATSAAIDDMDLRVALIDAAEALEQGSRDERVAVAVAAWNRAAGAHGAPR